MTDARDAGFLLRVLERHESSLLAAWLADMRGAGALRTGQIKELELTEQARRFIGELQSALATGQSGSIDAPTWSRMRALLDDISRSRALQGFSPSETATFVFSFKEPLFATLRLEVGGNGDRLAEEICRATRLIDMLGLYTTEAFQRGREEVIQRQQRELLELSTPVVQLWSRILALPLIGTLDSERTQIVMERLLQAIVESGAEIAIIDISGVPTVDTLVAQHLIKAVSAARLMGADCIISGIRPQIAQTIVHLGLDLNVVSKATMADAFALALRRTKQTVAATGSPRA